MNNDNNCDQNIHSADNNKYQTQEKCACFCKCVTSIVVTIAIIALIICAVYLLISFSGKYIINLSNEMSVYIALDHMSGNIDVNDGDYDRLTWPFALVSSVAIGAITFIICKILSVLKDIIETEQVKRNYNN